MALHRTVEDLSFTEKKEAIDKLKKLKGWPPYDSPSNICRADAYFAQSIEKKFGATIKELEKLLYP